MLKGKKIKIKRKKERKDENVRTLETKKDEIKKETQRKEKRAKRVCMLEIGNIIKFSQVVVTQAKEGK